MWTIYKKKKREKIKNLNKQKIQDIFTKNELVNNSFNMIWLTEV